MPVNHENTKVLLIGTSDFPEDPSITPIPNVKANIQHFKEVLIDPEIIGVPEANITISLNESRSQIERKLLDLSKQTNHKKYTLLVYYSGHGILSSEDYELYLTTYQTSKKYLETDAVNINDFKRDIRRSGAGRKIVLLDCCHSGAIIGTMGSRDSTIQAELMGFEGTYVMTSAAEDTPSLFPVESPDRPTYFTGRLLEILSNGLESENEYCSLREIYQQIESDLTQAGLPRPQQSNINTADQIYFSRNKKYIKPRPADELAWEETLKKNNKWAFKDFRRQFPESSFAEEARQHIIDIEEEECWKKSIVRNTISSLDDYLETYPNGKYVNEANQRLIELRKKEEQEEEDRHWEQAVMAGDLVSFETYLEEYPNGRYVQKCQVQIKRLRKEEKRKHQEEQAIQKVLARHIEQLELKAGKLMRQGHPEAALQLYYQVLELQPGQPHSQRGVTQCLERIEQAAAEKDLVAPGLPAEPERPLPIGEWIHQLKTICLAIYARLIKVIFKPVVFPAAPVAQEKEEETEEEAPPDFPAVADEVSPDRKEVPADGGEVSADGNGTSPDKEVAPDGNEISAAVEEVSTEGQEILADGAKEVSPAGKEISPDEDEVAADRQEILADVAKEIAPEGKEVSPDEDEASLAGEEAFPEAAEEVSPHGEEVSPDRKAGDAEVEEVSPYKEKVSPDEEEASPDGEEVLSDGEQTFGPGYSRNKKAILVAACIGLLAFSYLIGKNFILPDFKDLEPAGNAPAGTTLKPFPLLLADARYDQKAYRQALRLYEAAHLELDAERMRRIAWMYEKGAPNEGLNQNPARSFSWYVKAAKSGNVLAMGKLGNFYYQGVAGVVEGKLDSAFYWYLLSARNGDSIAMYNLGLMYRNGLGVAANKDSADTWFKKAAAYGIQEADE